MVNPVLFAADDPSVGLVVLLGVGIVFLGLIALIGICYIMGYVVNNLLGKKASASASAPATPAPSAPSGVIENRQEIIAGVVAAIAEEEGTDISAIRVISFKKV